MALTEEDIKNIMYGSIRELVNNKNYFYKGYDSYWTKEGKQVVCELMEMYAPKILESARQADEQRSRDMVVRELTK